MSAPVFTTPAAAQGLFGGIFGGSGSTPRQETVLDRMRADNEARADCGGDGQIARMNAYVEQGLGIVRDDALHAYLNGIVGRLLAQSTMPGCRVHVYVTPHEAAQAVALPDGGILIALGFLRNLKTEDEVAALLAHELSHILRNHHASDAFVDTQDSFLKGLDTANAAGSMLGGLFDSRVGAGFDAASSIGGTFYQISESMIAPAWTKDQEDEADLLGIDLMTAAGYNPRAMAGVMEVIAVQEANAEAMEAEREKLHQQRMQSTLLDSATRTDFSNPLSIVGAAANITTGILSGVEKKTHRSAEERKQSVNEYIKDFHNEHRRRAFTSQPWDAVTQAGESGATFSHYRMAADARRLAFTGGDMGQALTMAQSSVKGRFASHAYPRLAHSEVRLKQGDREKALQNLEIALKEPLAPWQLHRAYAELQMQAGNLAAATQAVERADATFDRPLGIAPFAIKVYKAAGDRARVDYYLDRCNRGGKREHLEICLTEAGVDKKTYMGGALMRAPMQQQPDSPN